MKKFLENITNVTFPFIFGVIAGAALVAFTSTKFVFLLGYVMLVLFFLIILYRA